MKHQALGALAGALALAALPAGAQEQVRYGHWASEGEAQYIAVEAFKKHLEENSDGRYTVEIFPNNQLGTPREMLAQLALGTTQIMASGDPGIKEIEYLSLPYLVPDIETAQTIVESDIGKEWNDKLINEREVRLLGFIPRSPRQISANVVIESIDDLKGLKLRAPERDYYVESLRALGANPTPMAFSEVYTALQTGVVDGQENPIETIYAAKFYEVQKGVALVDYIVKPAYVMISNSFYEGLSDEDKALFEAAQAESRAVAEELIPGQTEEFIAKMEEAGVTVTEPDRAPFREATAPVREKLGKEVWGEETYQKIVEMAGGS
jgi:tripartite ATP-independent transporter DctP family solute receptor